MMKSSYARLFLLLALQVGLISGCGKLESVKELATVPEPVVVEHGTTKAQEEGEKTAEEAEAETEPELQTQEIVLEKGQQRNPVQVKGIYISAYVAGTPSMVDNLIAELDRTEANTLVIDLKDDFGRVACEMESPLVQELGSSKAYISDIQGLMEKLEEHGI